MKSKIQKRREAIQRQSASLTFWESILETPEKLKVGHLLHLKQADIAAANHSAYELAKLKVKRLQTLINNTARYPY